MASRCIPERLGEALRAMGCCEWRYPKGMTDGVGDGRTFSGVVRPIGIDLEVYRAIMIV